jgi:thymidylate synthase ThyX
MTQITHGGYACEIRADSQNLRWRRLTTMTLTYPRFVHCELLTHRVFSRNSASSRAIPIATMLQRVELNPVMPVWWGRNQAGMQADEELNDNEKQAAIAGWLAARDSALQHARYISSLGVHKQIVNRLLEPWMWITVVLSSTDWSNWFALRCHPKAQPELRRIADMMFEAYHSGPPPRRLDDGEWHLPFLEDRDQVPEDKWQAIATGRCARVSYLTHEGKRDFNKDIELHDKLKAEDPGHWSPFEHVAMADSKTTRSRNFRGFIQYRATLDTTSVQD